MAGQVTVLVPGALRVDAGGESKLTAAGATLGAVLDDVAGRWPRLDRRVRDDRGELRRYVNIYVDGTDCRTAGGLAMPVPAGAEVQILPSVAGG